MTTVEVSSFAAPVGTIHVAQTQSAEIAGIWVDSTKGPSAIHQWLERQGLHGKPATAPPADVVSQFSNYFGNRIAEFSLPLTEQGTPFERAVWRELSHVGFGETISYGELADAIGHPGEAQRVGQACAANPWLIVVPCHRVVASDGALRGYAAGLHVKEMLLAHERGQPALLV